jgi:hypothetical protein
MSKAKKHHFLPQFLLRGFASRTKGDAAWVWEFRRGLGPAERPTNEVGGSRYFHGDPDVSDLESKIGDLESEYAPVIVRFRANQTTEEDLALASAIANHLLVRTKNIRDGFREAGEAAIAIIGQRTREGKNAKLVKNRTMKELRKRLRTQFADKFNALSKFKRKLMLSIAEKQLEEYLRTSEFRREATTMIDFFSEHISLKELVADAHQKALRKVAESPPQPKRFENLHWAVCQFPGTNIILGDVVGVARSAADERYRNALLVDNPSIVCIPVGSLAVLLGYRGADVPQINIEALNRGSAMASRDFFVASRSTDNEKRYGELISTDSALISEKDKVRFSSRMR